MNDPTNIPRSIPDSDFPESQGRKCVVAFLLGMAIVIASIFLGKSYTFYVSFLAFSILITLLWKNNPRPWILLVSISAATPIMIFYRYQIPCNLIFALWFVVFNRRYLSMLPRWIYVPAALAVLGIFTSSINWMSGDVLRDIMRQVVFAYNLFLGPFLLLPVVYLRMRESRNHAANLQGLLFCLIVPSTMILISAKLFGTVANEWIASLHADMLSEGFLQYKLGRVFVNFLRTEVGFILAALICASTAVTVSHVKGLYRLLAGVCLALNILLLFSTASFGSIFACLCGLAAILYNQFRTAGTTQLLVSMVAVCCMGILVYSILPQSTKEYLGKRYEHRVEKADTDRLGLWTRAMSGFLKHPEGVGKTFAVGGEGESDEVVSLTTIVNVKSFIHNDYLTYALSYGFLGGLGYIYLVVGLLVAFFQMRKITIHDPHALAINLAGLGVIVALSVNSMTDHSNENKWYFNIIWSLIWYSYFCSCALQTSPESEGIKNEIIQDLADLEFSDDASVRGHQASWIPEKRDRINPCCTDCV